VICSVTVIKALALLEPPGLVAVNQTVKVPVVR